VDEVFGICGHAGSGVKSGWNAFIALRYKAKRQEGRSGLPAKTVSKRLAPADYRLLAEFRRQLRQFLAFSEGAARKAGLAPQQHQALLAIKGFDGAEAPTVGDLADRLAVRHHSAVGLVDRLAQAGYLKRNTGETDRRRVVLTLTPRGEAVLARLTAAHRDELRRMMPLLRPLLTQLEK
jgi:DNA-binding MarR family transcriptional regulator